MQRIFAGIVVLILLLAGTIALWLYLGGQSGPVPLRIESTQGAVEVDHEGAIAEGEPGYELLPGDLVRTGADGRAVLSRAGRSSVELDENTALRFLGVEDESVTLALEGGRLRARVRPDAGAVRLNAAGATLVATDVDMDVANTEAGLQVEVQEGGATVSGVAGQASVRQGERLNVLPDGTSALRAIPDELLLDVQWPGRGREEKVEIAGKTEPGAAVTVRGQRDQMPTRADASGAFTVTMALAPGENLVEVEIEDGFGESTTREAKILRDVKAPVFELDMNYERRK